MKSVGVCAACGAPWARHVERCPGCGRRRSKLARVALPLAAAIWLACMLWK